MYKRTNETLSAVVAGLDVRPEDYILSIGGSGDQALAMIEYGGKILAVDFDEQDVEYMKIQVESIKSGDYASFHMTRNNGKIPHPKLNYFLGRLDRIRGNLPGLEIRRADLFDVCRNETGFNKIYLSSSLYGNADDIGSCLSLLSSGIPNNGLIYAANGDVVRNGMSGTGLRVAENLTDIANEIELSLLWFPVVLRKVEEPRYIPKEVNYDNCWAINAGLVNR